MTQWLYGKCLFNGILLFMENLSMVILFYQGNIEASIICHMQLCANKVTMYHFTHKAVGSHRS